MVIMLCAFWRKLYILENIHISPQIIICTSANGWGMKKYLILVCTFWRKFCIFWSNFFAFMEDISILVHLYFSKMCICSKMCNLLQNVQFAQKCTICSKMCILLQNVQIAPQKKICWTVNPEPVKKTIDRTVL